MILAIDTSGPIATLALGQNPVQEDAANQQSRQTRKPKAPSLIAEYHFAHDMDLLRRLTPGIEYMLKDADRDIARLTALAVSLGPGSFTGLRIGITAAKTLAWSLGIGIVGINTLEAIARSAWQRSNCLVCPMIYSRVGEVYWAVYDAADQYSSVHVPDVSTVEEVIGLVADLGREVRCCGNGARANLPALEAAGLGCIAEEYTDFARGSVLLDIARDRIVAADMDDPLSLCPLYVKKPTPVVRKEQALKDQANK